MPTDAHPGPLRVLVFGAALRAGSVNARLASLVARLVSDTGATADLAGMREFTMPLFDGDVEAAEGLPEGALALRDRLERCDAFVISSPEYNASVPGVLKNAIDWVSRVRPQPFKTKHALLVSASPSMVGGNRGLWALRIPWNTSAPASIRTCSASPRRTRASPRTDDSRTTDCSSVWPRP